MAVIGVADVRTVRVSEVTINSVAYLSARFGCHVISQGSMNIAGVMDALATKARTVYPRAYGYPVESVQPPAVVVSYPEDDITIHSTFGRGSDEAEFPIYVVVGKSSEKPARDALSAAIAGAGNLASAVDGALEG